MQVYSIYLTLGHLNDSKVLNSCTVSCQSIYSVDSEESSETKGREERRDKITPTLGRRV